MLSFDLNHAFAPGESTPDDVVQAFFRAFMPDFYFVNTPISRMRRHLQIIRRLPEAPLILDFHQPDGAHFTELTLCAPDDAQPGLLSKIAGALAHMKIEVHTAWIHTLFDPHDMESGRRIALDTLVLSESSLGQSRPLSAKTRERVARTLKPILKQQSGMSALLIKLSRRAPPLKIEELSATAHGNGLCRIVLRAGDDLTVLFRVTRALAMLKIDIAHAQISTPETLVDDVFFVRRAGGAPLENAEIASLLFALRETLQKDTLENKVGESTHG